MSLKKLCVELPKSKDDLVYVRGYYVPSHYRRRPRRRPPLVDPITERAVCKQLMLARMGHRRFSYKTGVHPTARGLRRYS